VIVSIHLTRAPPESEESGPNYTSECDEPDSLTKLGGMSRYGITVPPKWVTDELGGEVRPNWGPDGSSVRVELDNLMDGMSDVERNHAKLQLKAALVRFWEPLGHPDAAFRGTLTAIPGYLLPGRSWITLIVGVLGTRIIILRVCRGELGLVHGEDSDDNSVVVIDDGDWGIALVRWQKGYFR